MEWLNYHHLYYFWMVARTGSIRQASRELRISSPAISAQISRLEATLGEELFIKEGRRLALTEIGRVVFTYCEEIFPLGRELLDTIRDRPTGRPVRLFIGIVDALPKMIAQWLIAPALRLHERVRIVCREGSPDQLRSQLASHELDVVLSDAPMASNIGVRAYSHLLGECGTTFVAATKLSEELKGRFPASLDRAPILLPTENAELRRSLDAWFDSQEIHPEIVGEFQDYALLRAFAQEGIGVCPIPSVFESVLKKGGSLRTIGRTEDVRSRFYAISVERKIKHPAVAAICATARQQLFA